MLGDPSCSMQFSHTHLASRKRERRIITASQVLCFSCISMPANLRLMIFTIRSISFGEIGRVWLCSRRRLTTCAVNSLQACGKEDMNHLAQTENRQALWSSIPYNQATFGEMDRDSHTQMAHFHIIWRYEETFCKMMQRYNGKPDGLPPPQPWLTAPQKEHLTLEDQGGFAIRMGGGFTTGHPLSRGHFSSFT